MTRNMWRSALMLAIGLACSASASAMDFKDNPASGTLTIRDGDTPVLTYCYGDQLQKGVDPKYTRSCYIHPLFDLEGKPITEDFPKDHFHHRGVSWTWAKMGARGKKTQTWHPADPPCRQQFVKWLKKEAAGDKALLEVENKWVLGESEVVAREQVKLQVHPIKENSRAVDVSVTIEAVGGPLTLQGTEEGKKGYGGFLIRCAPQYTGARMLTNKGELKKDVVHEPYSWADLSTDSAGVAIFAAKDHPDFPPRWMIRNSYAGLMNVSWPGLKPVKLQPGKPVTLKYRLLVHGGKQGATELQKAFADFTAQP